MRVLIDTNIFIYRENYQEVPEDLQNLLEILNDSEARIYVHPLSIEEIEKDGNKTRRDVSKSKIKSYPRLESPPEPTEKFIEKVGEPTDETEIVDNQILYSVYKDAVSFLITEDNGIHRKANKIDLSQRVFNILEAQNYFRSIFEEEEVKPPLSLERVPMHNLNFEDPILDDLKEDYPNFEGWWRKKSQKGRKAMVYYKDKENNRLGGLLIYNIEDEAKPSPKFDPPLPKKERLKICTMTATETGYKIGELFIKLSVEKAFENDIDEIFLTHYVKKNDRLVPLIEKFGFSKVSEKDDEPVFLKSLIPREEEFISPLEVSGKYYPSFYDGKKVKKFLVPIEPKFHSRLFPDFKERQSHLDEFGKLITEGNTIKKAYLSRKNIKKISPGDILLFYRSKQNSGVTTLGVVEKAIPNLTKKEDIYREVGKRSVYSNSEIEEMKEDGALAVLFKYHFHLTLLHLDTLRDMGLYAPQSISEISHEKYLKIKERGGIDERFTVN